MKFIKSTLGALLCLSFFSASAEEVNGIQYNQISLTAGRVGMEGKSGTDKLVFDDFKGTQVDAQFLLNDFLVNVSYTMAKSDDVKFNGATTGSKTDLKANEYKFGYRLPIATGFDLVPYIGHGVNKGTVSRAGRADSDISASGNLVGLMARKKLAENVEGGISASRSSDETNSFDIDLLVKVHKSFAIKGGLGTSSGKNDYKGSSTFIGVAYLF